MTSRTESFESILGKQIERRLASLMDRFSKKNKPLAQEYLAYCKEKGFRPSTEKSYLQNMYLLSRALKKFPNTTKKDISDYLSDLDKGFKSKTITERRKFLKIFYTWYKDGKLINLVENISIKNDKGTKLPEQLLSPEDIKKMIQVADNFRDKAIISLLYESGARRNEFLKLKLKHIQLVDDSKKYAFLIIPKGKTDSRKIPIIFSLPHVINWINSHPTRDDTNSPLFPTTKSYKGRALGEDGLKLIVKKYAVLAGIKRRVHLHLFRHSRLTELAREITEQELKRFAGWTPGSDMARIYVHLSGDDVANKILANAGYMSSEKVRKTDILNQVECPTCKTLNGSDVKICQCGRVLDIKEAQKEIDGYKDKEKEFQEMVERQKKLELMMMAFMGESVKAEKGNINKKDFDDIVKHIKDI